MKYERNPTPVYPLEEAADRRSRGFAHSEKIIAGVKAARERKAPPAEPKCEGCGHPPHGLFCDTRTEVSNGDKDICLCEAGYISKNQPISPTSGEDLKDAVECLESLAIGLAAEAKSTATKSLRAKQCEIRSKAMFTVLDALKSKEAIK